MIRFREAQPHSHSWNLLKTAAQTTALWATFFVILPVMFRQVEDALSWPPLSFPGSDVVAIAVFLPFGLMAVSSGYVIAMYGQGTPWPLDTATRLVIRGPYRWVRNPMAVAGLTQTAAAGLWHHSWLTQGLVIAGFITWNYVVRPSEECDLERRFGSPYRAYCEAVPCWRPASSPYPPNPAKE